MISNEMRDYVRLAEQANILGRIKRLEELSDTVEQLLSLGGDGFIDSHYLWETDIQILFIREINRLVDALIAVGGEVPKGYECL